MVLGSVQLCFMLNSINLSANLESLENRKFRQLKISNSYILSPMVIDDTGSGDYTWGQAVLQPWCYGAGTLNNPYIIENVTIDGGGITNCIVIRDSSKHFIIRNSTFINSGWSGTPPYTGGITLDDVSNAMLINNTCKNCNGNGINIYSSNGVMIKDNILENNERGISSFEGDSNKIINNSLTLNNVAGIVIHHGENNEIKENKLNDGRIGIFLFS